MELNHANKLFLSNEAINARYDFSAVEIDLMVQIIGVAQRVNSTYQTINIELNIAQLIAHYNEASNSGYDQVKKALKGLIGKPYEIVDKENKRSFIASIISSSDYDGKTGRILCTMHPKILALVCDIKDQYTSFEIGSLLKLRGKYSKRLYLLLNQFKSTGVRFTPVDELKRQLRVDGKYDKLAELHRRVIDPAIEEINEYTELNITVGDGIRFGRKITELEFLIKLKKEIAQAGNLDKMSALMRAYGLQDFQIENIIATLEEREIATVLYQFQMNKATIKNHGGYLNAVFINRGVVMNRKINRQTTIFEHANSGTRSAG